MPPKLDIIDNGYFINSKKEFVKNLVSKEQLQQAIDFAFEMVYGNGHHRSTRSGGTIIRKRGEKFCNTFQGKLAEIVLYDLLKINDVEVSEPDFGIYGKDAWDDCDLTANGKRINVKSAAGFSNLLLLETKDWDVEGKYIPDLNKGKETLYDLFVLIRFSPDIKALFSKHKLFYSDNALSVDQLEEIVFEKDWFYDMGGCISNEGFKQIIKHNWIIPKGGKLNGNTLMDAENYYVQCGDMPSIEELIKKLKLSKKDDK